MKKLMALCVAATLLHSCNKDDIVSVKFDKETFLEQKQLWQASSHKDYQFQIFIGGGFNSFYNGVITIENGDFKNELLLDEHSSSISCCFSIDVIYETIEKSFYEHHNKKKSDFYITEISVEYDKVNHIPIKVNFGYYASSGISVHLSDYTLSNFSKIEQN
ncbi:MAG: DUF6174 domain-containing protein [Bacteroidales bacterium]|nr:DUF6174 domain-containing protein [Bacteroidales bacterium]